MVAVIIHAECSKSYDVVFILDLSGSIDDANQYYTIVNFTRAVIVGLGAGNGNVRVGVITFATTVVNEFFLKDFATAGTFAVWQAIEFTRYNGLTNINDAMSNVTLQVIERIKLTRRYTSLSINNYD